MAEEGFKVSLKIYDLSQGLARQLSSTFLGKVVEGIWHTGIVVYGNEYYFGGGIQVCPPGLTHYGRPLKEVELGSTQIPKEMFEEYLEEIKARYTEETYSLLHHNCNNFSEEVAQFLLGVSIPEYILKLPEEVMSSPMGALIMPMIQQFETTLKYGGVPQVPQATGSAGSQLNQTLETNDASPQLPLKQTTGSQAWSPVSAPTMAATSTNKENASTEVAEKVDKLGNARAAVQEEITQEFAALMAQGSLRASEAAALAARRVMERHGRGIRVSSES